MPKTSGPVFNVSDASSGRITWKLKPTVLTTVTISSTRRASGERHAQANPSPIALITVGGLALGSKGTSSSRRIISSPASTARNVTVLIAKQTPDPEGRDQDAGEGGPDDARRVEEAGIQRNGIRQLVAADHLERERVAPRSVEDESGAGENRQHVDDPDRLQAADHEDGERRREEHRDGLSADHEPAVVDSVGDDACEQAEDGEGDEAAEGEQSDGDRRARQLDDEPGERDVLHPGAADRDHLAGEEEAVVAVPLETREGALVERQERCCHRSFPSGSIARSSASSSSSSRPRIRSASQVVRRARTRFRSRSPSS